MKLLPEYAKEDSPVLVVVVNDCQDLARARTSHWYRIPLARAPRRVAADFLAFYQTGSFAEGERWCIRWFAPVTAYHIVRRCELIPAEPQHPRANDRYYKVSLGPLAALEHPIPSARLRRLTFIPTTMARLQKAREINDLWVKSSAQERLRQALVEAGIQAECEYPLRDDAPEELVDFAIPCADGQIAIIVDDEPADEDRVRETMTRDYWLVADSWTVMHISLAQLFDGVEQLTAELAEMVVRLGGQRSYLSESEAK